MEKRNRLCKANRLTYLMFFIWSNLLGVTFIMYTNVINRQSRTLCESLSPNNKISFRSNISISRSYVLCFIHRKSMHAKYVFYWGKIFHFQIVVQLYDMDNICPNPRQNYRLQNKVHNKRKISNHRFSDGKKKRNFLWWCVFTLVTNENRKKY